jgi:hypothetical protein
VRVADWQAETRAAAERYGLDPGIFGRQIYQESRFNPKAVSPAGALGIAQIMPDTARAWGVDPLDPHAALDAAAKNMARYVKQYGGSYRNALIAYNAGPGTVGKALPAETTHYIDVILGGRNPAAPQGIPAGTRFAPAAAASAPGATSTGPGQVDGGQAGDYTTLLQSLLSKPAQQAVQAALPAPAFSAAPALPHGFAPLASAAQVQDPGQGLASSTLGLLGSLRGTPPTVGSPAAPAASDSPRTPGVVQSVAAQRAGGSQGFHGSGVLELIYNDGGKGYGIKNGQVVNGGQVFRDVWAGHTNHVHVAAGKYAQSLGLHVGENPRFGGVDPVHVPGSYHYKGEAIDVSGDPQKLSKYAQAVEAYNASGRL